MRLSRAIRRSTRRAGRRVAFLGLRALTRVTGFPRARKLGALVGDLEFMLAWRPRARLLRDMAHALGRQPDAALSRELREAYRASDTAILEVMAMLDRPLDREVLARQVEIEGEDNLREACRDGRGAILLASHMGNSALVPVFLAARGWNVSVVSRLARMTPPEFFREGFGRYGVESITANEGLVAYRQMAAALRDGRVLFLMIDQGTPARTDGVVTRFLGKDMAFPIGPAHLAQRTRVPVLPMLATAAHPLWRFTIEAPVPGLSGVGFEAGTKMLAGVAERHIRQHPELWTWHQRRWRKYPRAPAGYP